MKTKIFFTAACLMITFFAFGQNKILSKEEIRASKVENSIQSGNYEIAVNQANPARGQVQHLTSNYSVRISGDSTYVYLPYYGRVYRAPVNGEGGIKLANLMENYKIDYKKGKNYSIKFTAKGNDDVYRFTMTVWTNGNTSINVTCNNRQGISYLGELKF